MRGPVLIPQDGRAVRPYGRVAAAGSRPSLAAMKPAAALCCWWCLLGLVAQGIAAAGLDDYPVGYEDYYIDQLGRQQRPSSPDEMFEVPRRLEDSEDYQGLLPQSDKPDFTYVIPPNVEQEDPRFAVRPPNPLYYLDTRGEGGGDNTAAATAEEGGLAAGRQHKMAAYSVDDDTFQVPRPGDVTIPPAPGDGADAEGTGERMEEKEAPNSRAQVIQTPVHGPDDKTDIYFIAIVAGCSAAAVVGVVVIGVSWYKLQKNAKLAADVEYPAYGVTGPNKETSPTGDRKLAHSAQMYHYQHQKQQIIAMESQAASERNGSVSEAESDEENEEGDYTVYECPGLAATGEMEVKNPLFLDDPTPATPANQAPTTNQDTDTAAPGDVNNTKK